MPAPLKDGLLTQFNNPEKMLCRPLGVVSFIALPLFLQVVIGQYTAEFQYPSGKNSYNILDTVIVQWNSSVSDSASLDGTLSNPVLFTWFLNNATDQVEQVSQVEVNQTGELEYNLRNNGGGLITAFPASLWFNLFYDTSVIATPNQEGFNGKVFQVYSNGAATPTTWALTTSFAGSPISGVSSPTGTDSVTKSGTGTSGTGTLGTTSTATQTSSLTATSTPYSTGGESLGSGGRAAIVITIIAVILLTGMITWLIRTRKRLNDLEKLLTPARTRSQRTATSGKVPVKVWEEGLCYDRREEHRLSKASSKELPSIKELETGETVSAATVRELETGETVSAATVRELETGKTGRTAAVGELETGETGRTAAVGELETGETGRIAAVGELETGESKRTSWPTTGI